MAVIAAEKGWFVVDIDFTDIEQTGSPAVKTLPVHFWHYDENASEPVMRPMVADMGTIAFADRDTAVLLISPGTSDAERNEIVASVVKRLVASYTKDTLGANAAPVAKLEQQPLPPLLAPSVLTDNLGSIYDSIYDGGPDSFGGTDIY